MSATPTSDARTLTGLSDAEAARRRAAGQGNDVQVHAGRTYRQIVRANVFNFINNLYFGLGALLIALGRWLDALVALSVILANTVVSLAQEIRAKRTIDRIAILTRPKATVVRDGSEREVDPAAIVVGDLLRLHPGDQVVVDGRMVGEGRMEIDESLLTGESDLVQKHAGDDLLSGSFCVTGGGLYEATRVGLDSFANKLTAKATSYRRELTPLQRQVIGIIRALLLIVLVFNVLVWARNILGDIPFVEGVRMSTVIVTLIPNGLVLSVALAYALGAMRMLGKGMLIQQANAVESLSNVDVVCTDKTGTLTSNVIKVHELVPLDGDADELEAALGDYAATTTDVNRTIEALQQAYAGTRRRTASEALFASSRKWSGLAYSGGDDGEGSGTFVLGAPEMIEPALAEAPAGAGREPGDGADAAADGGVEDDGAVDGAGAGGGAPGGADHAVNEPGAAPLLRTRPLLTVEPVPEWHPPGRWEWLPWVKARHERAAEAETREGEEVPAVPAAQPHEPPTEGEQGALFDDNGLAQSAGGEGEPGAAAEPAAALGWRDHAARLTAQGYRVLLFAGSDRTAAFADDPQLPAGLRPLALVAFSDELRPGVKHTLDEFGAAGIELKIISGDNPQTVAALAMQAGLRPGRDGGDVRPAAAGEPAFVTVSGADLERLEGRELDREADRASVFGRVTPEQKQDLIAGLRRRGRYVAMVGDGVNDVIALKQANVSVAMNSGSQASRSVADLVLLNDSFDALPYAFREGQRILNGMHDILKIFMVRIISNAVIIAVVAWSGGFPFAPRQSSLLAFLAAGIPAMAFAAWSRPGPLPKTSLFRRLVRFVLPAATLTTLMALGVYFVWAGILQSSYLAAYPGADAADLLENALPKAQTATTVFAALCGILVVPLTAPPSKWWVGGARLRGDWKFAALPVFLLGVLVAALATEGGRLLFEITPLPIYQYVILAALAAGWLMLVRLVWRRGILDRVLGKLDDPSGETAVLPDEEAAG